MLTKEVDYYLPKELIAQNPVEPRDNSRLLILDRSNQTVVERKFRDIIDYLNKGDVLVLNNTKVIKARIFAKKPTGAKIEILLLRKINGVSWEALLKPADRVAIPSTLYIGEIHTPERSQREIRIEKIANTTNGARIVKFASEEAAEYIIEKFGNMPLPPYIHTHLENTDRYQTVYASKDGSVAAPTAGLHFTEELLERIKQKGVKVIYVTLHLGLDSFRPIREEKVTEHKLSGEYFVVDEKSADVIDEATRVSSRIFACGTSVVRVLESVTDVVDGRFRSCAQRRGKVHPGEGITELFITPGYKFKIVSALITNFHLPRSSNLLLAAAFAGKEFLLRTYQYAIEKKFRFYSFGDAMVIV
ncbi:MAG: tRNA preQ1(34) S-adenosylmethionine ribosyltransferase-isomerase QueA [Elusimicrobiota bacterium]|nr:tRNA preQ1(34) S-adenosylmethionine ribosyltransferase-isomerase QueA [Elusimicrobiota bacterium]